MLDHFVIGRVDRISPEAPVPVVRFDHETCRLGGAANVAHNVAALGGARRGRRRRRRTTRRATAARRSSDALGSARPGIVEDPHRRTTRKLRVVTTRNQQVARIDYEDDARSTATMEAALVARIDAAVGRGRRDARVRLPEGRRVAAAWPPRRIAAARTRGIPVLVDPKVPHIDYYAGATVITPNHHEAEAVTHMRIRTSDEALAAARRFRERAGCDSVLDHPRRTRDDAARRRTSEAELPAEAREVADVTGAGDTVIATMALALAAGASLVDAARLANRAAGIVVGKFGPATVIDR